MLAEVYPRKHTLYASLPVLGQHLDGFVVWLRSQGYPSLPIRLRVRAAKQLDARLRRDGVHRLESLSAADLRSYAPADSQDDIYQAALVHSLVPYLEEQKVLAPTRSTPALKLIASYCIQLQSIRGLAAQTVSHHAATVRELLAFLGEDQLDTCLSCLDGRRIEGFLQAVAERLGRESLQHTVAYLRSFLRFLASRGLAPSGLDTQIDTSRVYRGERLPRSLPWETVLAFLQAIDRSTPRGRRDYAMFLLVVTYGLRCCEVVSLKLDDIGWRDGQLRVTRSKVRSSLLLPLTPQVGAALLAYIRDDRPALAHREVFLRVRAPAGTLKPTALTEAFQSWARRCAPPIPFQGPHCLRHSLAVHLLRQGTSLKTIGDLLGHRSPESTCVYLRLHVEDLRDVAIGLPVAAHQEVLP